MSTKVNKNMQHPIKTSFGLLSLRALRGLKSMKKAINEAEKKTANASKKEPGLNLTAYHSHEGSNPVKRYSLHELMTLASPCLSPKPCALRVGHYG